ncbi:unnamed protein product [Ectocarpus sp. CCAP 1310/34]|nr:unnamed protein product [Ectocarpus sp. CCAP 1310/34]
MTDDQRLLALSSRVRQEAGEAGDLDREAALRDRNARLDAEFNKATAERQAEIAVYRARRATNTDTILTYAQRKQAQEREEALLAAQLADDRRQEDASVAEQARADQQREHDLRVRAGRSVLGPAPAAAPAPSASVTRTYAAAASSPVIRSSSRSRSVTFEAGDARFTQARLPDVAKYAQANYQVEERKAVIDLAAGVSTGLPSTSSIQDTADVANGSRPDLQDVVGCLLVAMRAATMKATSPVVWPGCTVAAPAPSAFQHPKAGRVKAKPAQRTVRESSSGEDSGWSNAGASRRPPQPSSSACDGRARQQAKGHTIGTRGSGGGSGSGADRSLTQSTALGRVLLPGNL